MVSEREKPVLAILDEDPDYAWRLSEYMNAKSGFPFEACAFSEAARLLAFMEDRRVDALLLEAELLAQPEGARITKGVPMCALLTQEPQGENGGDSPYPTLVKYQPARKLIDDLLDRFARHADTAPTPRDDLVRERPVGSLPPGTELIGVFSPVGRCGKTAFSLTLGEILGESKRTLYLDMERYSGFQNMGITQEAAGDLNDLLYYHRIDPGSLVYRLGALVRTFRNLDYITPAASGEDVMAVRASEWIDLFAALAAAGEYEALVLDLGISLEEVLPVLSACTRIYMPVLDDQVSVSKVEQFFQAAEQMGLGFLAERIQRLHLPVIREELWGKDISSRLVRGRMGAYVRKLL